MIEPWDPFLTGHPAVNRLPSRAFQSDDGGASVEAQGFVLPHKDKFSSPTDYDRAAGPAGWISQQGFYVYRNRRLLVAGGWLDLGLPRDEQHKLARIQVDLPNTLDAAWDIDVKKSRARPPPHERDQMRSLADSVRTVARSVYVHRGKFGGGGGPRVALERPWIAEELGPTKGLRHKIDRSHALVHEARQNAGDPATLDALLRLLEETVPIERIWLEATERPGAQPAPFEEAPDELLAVLRKVYAAIRNSEASPEEARRRLSLMEPFNRYPDIVAKLADQ